MGQGAHHIVQGGQTWVLPQAVVGLEAGMSMKDAEQQGLSPAEYVHAWEPD